MIEIDAAQNVDDLRADVAVLGGNLAGSGFGHFLSEDLRSRIRHTLFRFAALRLIFRLHMQENLSF